MTFVLVLVVLIIVFVATGVACSPGARAWSLAHFTEYIAATVRRNLPLGSSLSAYARDLPARRFGKRKALFEIADAVDNGAAFADTLDRHTDIFPKWYRALVRAGERGGNLARVLDRLNTTAELDLRDARRLTGMALYPAALAGVAVVMFMTVMGKFTMILSSFTIPGGETSFVDLASAGRMVGHVAFVIFAGLVAASLGSSGRLGALGNKFPAMARAWSWLAWHAPLVSRFVRRRAVSQWALAAGELMEAGLPTHEALTTAASSSGNLHLDKVMRRAAASVAEGAPLSEAIRRADPRREIPPEVAWYVETGERSGRLPEALARVSQTAALRSRSSLGHLITLVLPAGILLVALSVGLQTVAIFAALNECNEAVRNPAAYFARAAKSDSRGNRKKRLPKQRSSLKPAPKGASPSRARPRR